MHHRGKLNIFLLETAKSCCMHTKQSWRFLVSCSLIFFLKILLLLVQLEIVAQAEPLQRKYTCNGLSFSVLPLSSVSTSSTFWTSTGPSGSLTALWCLWKGIHYYMLCFLQVVVFFFLQVVLVLSYYSLRFNVVGCYFWWGAFPDLIMTSIFWSYSS